jgi:hypothetical protein
LKTKAQHAEAEPLYRQALAIAAMELDAAEQTRRLAAFGAEAGLDDAAYRQLLADHGAGAAPGTAFPRPGGARGGIRTAATALPRALGLRRPG